MFFSPCLYSFFRFFLPFPAADDVPSVLLSSFLASLLLSSSLPSLLVWWRRRATRSKQKRGVTKWRREDGPADGDQPDPATSLPPPFLLPCHFVHRFDVDVLLLLLLRNNQTNTVKKTDRLTLMKGEGGRKKKRSGMSCFVWSLNKCSRSDLRFVFFRAFSRVAPSSCVS